jgi:hypothetical protein
MFRLIILMQLKEGVDPQPFVEALDDLAATVPSVRSAVATGDLGLTKEYGHNASFSWVAEFDDQAAWMEYIQSAEHDAFYEMYKDQVEQFLVNQWAFD